MRDSEPILLLTGPPGAGKTTVARLLASRLRPAVHLESDDFFRFIRSGYIDPWKPEAHQQNVTVMRLVSEAALGYANAGYFTIVDGIFLPGWFFEPARDALVTRGKSVAYAVLRAPLAVCQSRSAGRGTNPLGEAVALEQLWNGFADLGDLERHVVDTESADPPAIADHIVRNLNELRVRPGSMTPRLRAAEASDRPFVVEMARLACSLDDRPIPPPDDPAVVALLPASGEDILIAVASDGRQIGAAWWHLHEPALVADTTGAPQPELAMGVIEAERGKGVGTMMVEALAAEAAEKFDSLTANVHLLNPAVRLYVRTGFHVAGHGRGRYGVAMRRRLRHV